MVHGMRSPARLAERVGVVSEAGVLDRVVIA